MMLLSLSLQSYVYSWNGKKNGDFSSDIVGSIGKTELFTARSRR